MDDVYIPLDDHGIPIATIASVKKTSQSSGPSSETDEKGRASLATVPRLDPSPHAEAAS